MTVEKIISPVIPVTVESLKSNTKFTISVIKEKLGKGCSPTNALDIQAAAIGLNTYKQFKGAAERDFYQIQTNIGTNDKPFLITEDLGFFDEYWSAREAMSNKLSECKQLIKWNLLCNGEAKEDVFEYSKPHHSGLTMTVEVYGDAEDDLIMALETVTGNVGNREGHEDRITYGYSFTLTGKEVAPNVYTRDETHEFVLIDNRGWISKYSKEEEDNARSDFRYAGNRAIDTDPVKGIYQDWEGELLLLQATDLSESDDIYALDSNGKLVCLLGRTDMLEDLKKTDEKLYLFCRIDSKKHKGKRKSELVSFRAKLECDWEKLRSVLINSKASYVVRNIEMHKTEPQIELELLNLSIDDLYDEMKKVPDSHVMYETLRSLPLSENPLSRRDYWIGKPDDWAAENVGTGRIISFQVEVECDWEELQKEMKKEGIKYDVQILNNEDKSGAGIFVQLVIFESTIDEVYECMLKVPDGKYMSDTVRALPLSENSFESRPYWYGKPTDWTE